MEERDHEDHYEEWFAARQDGMRRIRDDLHKRFGEVFAVGVLLGVFLVAFVALFATIYYD